MQVSSVTSTTSVLWVIQIHLVQRLTTWLFPKRRANDALNELVRQGIDRNVITAEGKGETEPFVQTGDGVKEQLNRRTEVLITLGSIGAIN